MAKPLKYIKKELSFREAPGMVYGFYDNYLVSFSLQQKKLELFVDAELDEDSGDMLDGLKRFIQANAAAYHLSGSSFSNTGISVTVAEKEYQTLLEFFVIFMNQLKLLRVPGADYCANCGSPIARARTVIRIGRHAHTCDEPCAQKIVNSKKAQVANKVSNRVLLGTIGAILIGLIGIIPYIYLGSVGLTCAYAAFLIPVLAGFGFYVFGGKAGVGKLIVCIIIPLLLYAVAVVGLLGYSVYLSWMEEGYVFTLAELITTLFDTIRTNAFLQEEFIYRQVLYGGIYLLIGYVFTLPTAYAKSEPYFGILEEA